MKADVDSIITLILTSEFSLKQDSPSLQFTYFDVTFLLYIPISIHIYIVLELLILSPWQKG